MDEIVKGSLLVPLGLLLLTILPALGEDHGNEEGAGLGEMDETFTRWVRSGSWTLDPVMATDSGSTEIIAKLFDTLIQFKAGTTEIEPGLAESWDISPDGIEYTFHLRKGVKFHNGEEMTANDVKYSIDRLMDPATTSPRFGLAQGITKVSVTDELTVKITTGRASASLLPRLAYPCFSIIPKDGLNLTHPLGTGPYRLLQWHQGRDVIVEAFDEYWGGRPCVQRYVMHPVEDDETIWQGFRDGTVSLTDVPSAHWEEYVDDPEMRNYTAIVPELATYWLIFNCERWPFKEKAVRNAVCCALEKEKVLDGISQGRYMEARGPLPPGLWGFSQTSYDEYAYTYNPWKAREILDNAGIVDTDGDGVREYEGKPLVVEYSSYISNAWQTASETHLENLRAIGIEATYRQYDFATLIGGKMDSSNFTMLTLGWIGDYADSEDYMINFETGNIPDPNSARYSNPVFDELAERARREMNFDERLRLYGWMIEILQEDNPHFWFFHSRRAYVWQPWVPEVTIGPLGFPSEKMVARSCEELYPEEATQLEEMFSEAKQHIREAREAGTATDQMEAYLSAAEDFWAECDHGMAQTYLEGILETRIPEPVVLCLLSLILLPTLLRRSW
jgi:peptide/nickel transport system substrate-binding protein